MYSFNLVGVVGSLLVVSLGPAPPGSAITYQGQLKQDGVPVDGPVDLHFTLWDAFSGGNANPHVHIFSGWPVVNGLFTVELDFGPDAFNGDARWISVDVAYPAGTGNYVPLAGRQRVSAAPYALFALNVPWNASGGNISNSNPGNIGIGTASPNAKLSVNGPENSGIADGVLQLFSPGGLLGNIMTLDGNEINGWAHLHLNPDASTNVLMVEGGGNVGIGTGSPAVRLHVVGGTDASPAGGGFAVFGQTNSTNIAIDNNEIMARNNGTVSALYLNNNGGDIVCGGALDIGYEIITAEHATSADARCPAGKKVIGGGCSNPDGGDQVELTQPDSNGVGWYCKVALGEIARAFAICANVK